MGSQLPAHLYPNTRAPFGVPILTLTLTLALFLKLAVSLPYLTAIAGFGEVPWVLWDQRGEESKTGAATQPQVLGDIEYCC